MSHCPPGALWRGATVAAEINDGDLDSRWCELRHDQTRIILEHSGTILLCCIRWSLCIYIFYPLLSFCVLCLFENVSFLFAFGVGVIWMAFRGFQRSTSRRNDFWKKNVTVEIIQLHAERKLFLHAWKQRQQHSVSAASAKQEASVSGPVSLACSPCSRQGSGHKRDSQVLVSSKCLCVCPLNWWPFTQWRLGNTTRCDKD